MWQQRQEEGAAESGGIPGSERTAGEGVGVKTTVVPVVIGVGALTPPPPHKLEEAIQQIPGTTSESSVETFVVVRNCVCVYTYTHIYIHP